MQQTSASPPAAAPPPRAAAPASPTFALRARVFPTPLGPVTVRFSAAVTARTQRIDATGSTEPVTVLLHGAAGSWTTFEQLLATLYRRNPRAHIVLVDLPGWGSSPLRKPNESFSIESQGAAVVGILSTLGYQRWHAVGHSMGGFLALHLASAEPARTASIAVISATTFAAVDAVRSPRKGMRTVPALTMMLALMRVLSLLGPAGTALIGVTARLGLLRPLMAPFFSAPRTVPASTIRSLAQDARPRSFVSAAAAAADYDLAQWRNITAPTLITRGRSDVFTTERDLYRLKALIPHAHLRTLDSSGHFGHVEQASEVARLTGWLIEKPRSDLP